MQTRVGTSAVGPDPYCVLVYGGQVAFLTPETIYTCGSWRKE